MLKQIIHTMLFLLFVNGVSFFASAHNDASTLLEDVNKDGTVNIQDNGAGCCCLGTTE